MNTLDKILVIIFIMNIFGIIAFFLLLRRPRENYIKENADFKCEWGGTKGVITGADHKSCIDGELLDEQEKPTEACPYEKPVPEPKSCKPRELSGAEENWCSQFTFGELGGKHLPQICLNVSTLPKKCGDITSEECCNASTNIDDPACTNPPDGMACPKPSCCEWK